jgi:enterochelin esterase-like enzyme
MNINESKTVLKSTPIKLLFKLSLWLTTAIALFVGIFVWRTHNPNRASASVNVEVGFRSSFARRPSSSVDAQLPKPTSTPVVVGVTKVASAQTSANETKTQTPSQPLCANPTGQLITETIPSKIIAVPMQAHVFLPPCYSSDKKYPTLYLIHGTNFDFGGWVYDGVPRVADIQMTLGTLPRFIIVMPSADMKAGERGKYSWSNGGKGSYEDYFVNELVPFIDSKFNTLKTRESRAIGGISRGGYWSIQIALSHPDKFGTLGAHSPSITTKLTNYSKDFSMLNYAKSLNDVKKIRIWLDAGDKDWARFDVKEFADDLKAKKIDFKTSVGRGEHADEYWSSRVGEYLAYYSLGWSK